MSDATDRIVAKFGEALRELSPDGTFDDEDAERVQKVAALMGELVESRRVRDEAMGWVDVGPGRKRWNPDVPKTPEEEEEGAARLREMAELRQPPAGEFWDPNCLVLATGRQFSSKSSADAFLKDHGLTMSSKYDIVNGKRPDPKKIVGEIAEKTVQAAVRHIEDVMEGRAPAEGPLPAVRSRQTPARPQSRPQLRDDGLPAETGDLADDVGPIRSSQDPVTRAREVRDGREYEVGGGEIGYSGDELAAEEFERVKHTRTSGTLGRLAGIS